MTAFGLRPSMIVGGRLHVRGIPDWGPWNPSRLEWDVETFVDILLSTRQAGRKIWTREKLEAVMKEPRPGPCGRYPGGWPTIRFNGLETQEIRRRTPRLRPAAAHVAETAF